MFIFYKMEYVIAYKMLFKESIDEGKKKKTPFFLGGGVTGPMLEHAIEYDYFFEFTRLLCWDLMTRHHFV